MASTRCTRSGNVGHLYAFIMFPICLVWVGYAAFGFAAPDTRRWARRMFFTSLVVLVSLCFAIALP
jgi:heme O synthase-like polyprenyltransferase